MKRFNQFDSSFYASIFPGDMLAWCRECNNTIEAAVCMKVISVTPPKNSFWTGGRRGNVRVQLPNQMQVDLFENYPNHDIISDAIERYIESIPGLNPRMNRQVREMHRGSDHYSYSFPIYVYSSKDSYALKQLMEKEMNTRKHQAEMDKKYAQIQAAAKFQQAQMIQKQNAQAAGQIDDLFRCMGK